jgi:trk system potassium uptake protein
VLLTRRLKCSGVTVVGIERAGQDFTYATAETVLEPDDLIIVSGRTGQVERFSELA